MKDFGFDICKGATLGHKHLEEYFGTICYPNYCNNLVSTRLQNGDLWAFSGYPIDSIERSNIVDLKSFKKILTSIDGPFFSLYWENKSNRVILVTDILGIFPIYWKIEDNRIRICNKILPLASKPNLASWGAFYTYGCAIGNNTLAEGVERLPPASCITISPDNLKITQETYWTWPERNRKASVDEVYDALIADLERIRPQLSNPNILLSGGFDSRLLAYALNDINIKPNAVIVSHSDEKMDLDGRCARRVASTLNLPVTTHYPSTTFFESTDYLNYLIASEAETPSFGLFISKVYQYVPKGEIFDGLIPGYTLPLVHQPPGGPSKYISSIKLFGSDSDSYWKSLKYIFTVSSIKIMREGAYNDFEQEIVKYDDSDIGTVQFICMNKMRNRTSINPFKVYSNKSIPIGIGISRRYIDAVSQLEFKDRKDAKFYISMFAKKHPSALSIPVLSGGTRYPLNANPLLNMTYFMYEKAYNLSTQYPSIAKYIFPSSQIQMYSETVSESPFLKYNKIDSDYTSDYVVNADEVSLINFKNDPALAKCLYHWKIWNYLLHSSTYS